MGQTIIAFRAQTDVPISVDVNRNGGVTGLTIAFKIFNGANLSEFLDFNDGTFKAAGHTTPTQNLIEVSAADAPGAYAVAGGFDLTGITVPSNAASLHIHYEITAGGEMGNEWDTIQFVDQLVRDAMKLAPSAGAPVAGSIDDFLGDILTDTGTTIPALIAALNDLSIADVQTALTNQGYSAGRAVNLDNLDATVSSRSSHSAPDVDAVLSGTHGGGSWTTAVGFATPGDAMSLTVAAEASLVDAVWDEPRAGHGTASTFGFFLDAAITTRSTHSAADVNTVLEASHGGGSWQTAVGFSTPADVAAAQAAIQADIAALNNLSAAEVWDYDLTANYDITVEHDTAGAGNLWQRMQLSNRVEEQSGTPGLLQLFNDADNAVVKTWQVRPETGNTVGEILGSPARRSVAV